MTSSTTKLWNPYAEGMAFAMWLLSLIAAVLFWMHGRALLFDESDDCAHAYVAASTAADSARVDRRRTEIALPPCARSLGDVSADVARY